MPHTLPKLPYAYNALEPHIDARTMEIHHTKHHQAYIDNMNKALAGQPKLEKLSVNDLLKSIKIVPENIRQAVINHGGGHANHSLFWTLMSPKGGGSPQGDLAQAINKAFSSFDKFREQFAAQAMGRFGSGWAWLVSDSSGLKIISTPNQDSPLMQNLTPLLGIDVWEHAYYILYKWQRAEYIKNWWNVVNWQEVEKRYHEAIKA